MNILMVSWVAARLPHPRYQSLLCSAGSRGYSAFRRSLEPGYPEHTILLTNVDVRDIMCPTDSGDQQDCGRQPPPLIDDTPSTDGVDIYRAAHNHLFSTHSDIGYVVSRIMGTTAPRVNDGLMLSSLYHLAPVSNVSSLPPMFLERRTKLKSLDLSYMVNLKLFPPLFLENCTGLASIDLSGQENVSIIYWSFLQGCTALTAINLSPLINVTQIYHGFLQGCCGLTTINFSGLVKVKVLRQGFLEGCTGLVTLDLHGLDGVEELPPLFLSGCTSLTAVNFTPLKKVTCIPWGFLENCSSMCTVDLTGLHNVVSLPSRFVEGCARLHTINNPPLKCKCVDGGGRIPEGWRSGGGGENETLQWRRVGLGCGSVSPSMPSLASRCVIA